MRLRRRTGILGRVKLPWTEMIALPGQSATKVRSLGNADREHLEQCALVSWCRAHQEIEPRLKLLFSIPNEGKRSFAVAARLKARGLVSGVPDLCLPVPSGTLYIPPYSCLFIEMKAKGQKPRKHQKEWAIMALGKGPLVVWHDSWTEAAEEICEYLAPTDLRPPDSEMLPKS